MVDNNIKSAVKIKNKTCVVDFFIVSTVFNFSVEN
jgi:hypothetical protein